MLSRNLLRLNSVCSAVVHSHAFFAHSCILGNDCSSAVVPTCVFKQSSMHNYQQSMQKLATISAFPSCIQQSVTASADLKTLPQMVTGFGTLQGIQEIHGNVRDHRQPQGHLPASRRQSAQVSSQVQFDARQCLQRMDLFPYCGLTSSFQPGSLAVLKSMLHRSPCQSIDLFCAAALLEHLSKCIKCKALRTFECIQPDIHA